MILIILFCGEFLLLLLTGFFNTESSLLRGCSGVGTFATTNYYIMPYYYIRNIQLLIITLFGTISLYCIAVNNQFSFNAVLLYVALPVSLLLLTYAVYDIFILVI